jgi:hypothetical protein
MSEPKAHSRACGRFFMGSEPIDGKPIKLNGKLSYVVFNFEMCGGISG